MAYDIVTLKWFFAVYFVIENFSIKHYLISIWMLSYLGIEQRKPGLLARYMKVIVSCDQSFFQCYCIMTWQQLTLLVTSLDKNELQAVWSYQGCHNLLSSSEKLKTLCVNCFYMIHICFCFDNIILALWSH